LMVTSMTIVYNVNLIFDTHSCFKTIYQFFMMQTITLIFLDDFNILNIFFIGRGFVVFKT